VSTCEPSGRPALFNGDEPGSARCPRALVIAALMAALPGNDASAQCGYDLTEMPGLSCGFYEVGATGFGLNEHGIAVGRQRTCGGEIPWEAFVWTPGEGVELLPRPWPFQAGEAHDIDCHGRIVGCLQTSVCKAVMWEGGRVTELGIPAGGNYSEAFVINDSGQVVGQWGNTATGDPAAHGFLWQDGEITDLGPVLGTEDSSAKGINEQGDVVGWMGSSSQIDAHAFLLSDGVVIDLGVIPGGYTAIAADVNERRQVVGSGLLEDPQKVGGTFTHAFLWSQGRMIDLGVLPPYRRSGATAINSSGQIVGPCWDGPVGAVAFFWQHGLMHDLNDLVTVQTYRLKTAYDINEDGQILALNGSNDPVLLTPVGRPPTDLDIDCRTDLHDLIILLREWGRADSPADFDGDGDVGTTDLLLLLAHWG
jgi:probable HAF family extracellular repeat protein